MIQSEIPAVSVIVPFYNEDKFLGEAIESVLCQDFVHWELLLIDDGSTDKSTAIARSYAVRYPDRIFYHEHEDHGNKGLTASRNLGVKAARGEYIALLDADDVWLPGKLTHQLEIFRQYPDIAMVAEASTYWYSWSDPSKEDVHIPLGAPQDQVFEPVELSFHLYPLSKGAAPCPCALIFKKDVLEKLGGFEGSFTKEYSLYEDQALLSKIYLHEKVYVSSACNNLYRQRPGSIVVWVTEDGHYHKVRSFFLEWYVTYLKQQDVHHPRLMSLIKKNLLPYHFPVIYYLTHHVPYKILHIYTRAVNHFKKRFN